MNLPNLSRAVISQTKLTNYLLNPYHLYGRHKATFFISFGFLADSWEALASALLRHAAEHELAAVEETPFGMRYTIEGELTAPDGRTPEVRVVWYIRDGEDVPRLVTAYPIRRRPQ
jgi:hypothetical protein